MIPHRIGGFLLTVFSVLIWLPSTMHGQDTTSWVWGEGGCAAANLTPEQARQRAIDSALRDAIEKKCGIEVSSQTVVQNFMVSADIIESIHHGLVPEYRIEKIWREDFRTAPDAPFQDLIKVRLRARVVCEDSPADPEFAIRAEINRNAFQDGDKLELSVTPTKASYLTVLNIMSDGQIAQIYPLKSFPQREIAANSVWYYPQPLMVRMPKGKKKVHESIYIIATKVPFRIFMDPRGAATEYIGEYLVWKRPVALWKDVVRALMTVPRDQRTATVLTYSISR